MPMFTLKTTKPITRVFHTCSSKAYNDTVDYVENKAQTYQLFYSQCMRDHLAAE